MNSILTINNSIFTNFNRSALYFSGYQSTISNSTFINCTSPSIGGAIYYD